MRPLGLGSLAGRAGLGLSRAAHVAPCMSAQPPAATDAAPPPPQPKPPAATRRARPDLAAEPLYQTAGLTDELYRGLGGPRFRQHVNPLRADLHVPLDPPADWAATFPELGAAAPLVLDVGAGYGRFLLALAPQLPGRNLLGVEIRAAAVDRAQRWAAALGAQRRVAFMKGNATVSLRHLLAGAAPYPGPLELLLVQFPDPHWKKRHHKRRIVQPATAAEAAALLTPGGRILLQSDVLPAAEAMRDAFERAAGGVLAPAPEHAAPGATFREDSPPEGAGEGGTDGGGGGGGGAEAWRSAWAEAGWLRTNPIGVPTERELYCLSQGQPVYRVLLEKRRA